MAEHHQSFQTSLLTHAAEGQQGSKGLACPRPGKHQQIAIRCCCAVQSTAQQQGQLCLPLPRTNGRRQVKGWGGDGGSTEDESF